MKEVKNAENNEAKEVEEVVKESKLKKLGSKVATTFKKNGKKMYTPILQGTGIAELQKYVVEKKDQSGDTPKDGGTTTQP